MHTLLGKVIKFRSALVFEGRKNIKLCWFQTNYIPPKQKRPSINTCPTETETIKWPKRRDERVCLPSARKHQKLYITRELFHETIYLITVQDNVGDEERADSEKFMWQKASKKYFQRSDYTWFYDSLTLTCSLSTVLLLSKDFMLTTWHKRS